MTEVTTGAFCPKISGSYFPTIPPNAPKAAMTYTKSVQAAPYTALVGVVVDGRRPIEHPVTPKCRVRNQVGFTNRWRLPQSLGSDLLGTRQALKAINLPLNKSMLNIITAENPKHSVNLDIDKPYSFRVSNDRPGTVPAQLGPAQSDKFLPPKTAPGRYNQHRPLSKCNPTSARPARPLDIFQYHSKRSHTLTGPDVLLHCLDMNWELHRPFLQKSETLSDLLETAEDPSSKRYYRNKLSDKLDKFIEKGKYYTSEYQEEKIGEVEPEDVDNREGSGIAHPKHISQQRISNKTVLTLDIADPLVTKNALAIALGNLYHEEVEVEMPELVAVLAAAHHLKFAHLKEGCAKLMLKSVTSATVCMYHEASMKYDQDHVKAACERWLELNIVPELSGEIQLRQLPMCLLQKVLTSNRLFTFNEFWLYRVLSYWVFLQMNPNMQLMPSYSTVLTFFNSLPKSNSLIEREEGQHFAQLFMSLRLHGVTDTSQMQDIQTMNIIPQAWVVKILTQHYHALQGGGDMSLMKNFNTGAIRQGFIIDVEPHYHSEILSLHGFHFELKAVRQNSKGSYSFFIQRLRPGDPILSFRQCERHTFSMRPDREVCYSIKVQHFDKNNAAQMYTTGMLKQKFGHGAKTSKSEIIILEKLLPPIYVTFSVHFPPS